MLTKTKKKYVVHSLQVDCTFNIGAENENLRKWHICPGVNVPDSIYIVKYGEKSCLILLTVYPNENREAWN